MGVFYMFLSESDYDSLCTFPLQLSWGPHSQFFLLADYLLHHICDRISSYPSLQIIFPAILVTAFTLFFICRLSPAPYLWPHSQFFSFADYLCSILVTAFALFFICRLSPAPYLWPHFQLSLICRLSPAPYLWPHSQFFSFEDYLLCHICDRISIFSHLQIISALYLWLHSHFFPFADYLCSILVTAFTIFSFADYLLRHTSPTTVLGMLTGRSNPVVWTRNTREACVTRCRLVSATKPTVWASASLGNWRITDACSE